MSDLQDRVMHYAAERPSGVTISQVSRDLGLPLYGVRETLKKHGRVVGWRLVRGSSVRVYTIGREQLRPLVPVKLWPHVGPA